LILQISNLSKANKRRGPRVNGRQLYGIFHGDFGVGRHILKLKFLDVEVGERVVEDSADGSAVMLRLEAGKYVDPSVVSLHVPYNPPVA
jgi:hypothetical protein